MKLMLRHLWVAIVGLSLLSACSTDEIEPSVDSSELWKGELAAAPYSKDAVCLKPKGATVDGQAVSTIELTASGLYFITYEGDNAQYNAASLKKANRRFTRDWLPYYDIVSGDFTPLGGNKYRLKNWGDITINSDGSITVELEEGGNYVWPVTKVDRIDESALNSRLCRTWNLINGHIDFLDEDLNVIYSMKISEKEMDQDYIYAVTFTYAGRAYRKDYPEDPWYGGSWRWSDMRSQLVEMHSDDPEDGEGIFQVLFDNNNMEVMNPTEFYDGEEARWEFNNISGWEWIPDETRYAREYINLKAMN